ncbi:MAG: twin-arginine translocase TatA/TatE family subunit [Acidimicrobiia bacterium]
MSLGPAEILVIFVIALLVFGPNRLPEIGRQVGKGVREIRKFQQTLRSDFDDVLADDESDHVEPAPTLPPLAEDTPTAQAGDAVSTPDIDDAGPPPDPATPTDPQ